LAKFDSHLDQPFLTLHSCTVRNPAEGYAENAETTADYTDVTDGFLAGVWPRDPAIGRQFGAAGVRALPPLL